MLCQVDVPPSVASEVSEILENSHTHFTAAFFGPVLSLVRCTDPMSAHKALVHVSFLTEFCSVRKIIPADLTASALRQVCNHACVSACAEACSSCLMQCFCGMQNGTVGQWSMLALLLGYLEEKEKKAATEADLNDITDYCKELENALEEFLGEQV